MFDHEKLKVYQRALDFVEWVSKLKIKQVKPKPKVIEHLDDASTSIVLNIAEGNGKYSSKDRCNYFDISRGSALESAAALDVLLRKTLISESDNLEGKGILKDVISMLVGLIKSNSNRVYEKGEDYGVIESD